MKILCVLQNAWGDGWLPMIFRPNPRNHSAKVIQKIIGSIEREELTYYFSNTTPVVTKTAKQAAKIDDDHMFLLIKQFYKFDAILVCGAQAKKAIDANKKYVDEQVVDRILYIKHPAARDISKEYVAKTAKDIENILHSKFNK